MKTLTDALAYMRAHGAAIGSAARSGDALAQRIISIYQMVYVSPGPASIGLLLELLTEWQSTHVQPET